MSISNLCKQKIFFLLVNVTKYSLYGILEQIRVNIFLVFYRYSIFSFQIICLKTSIFFEERTLFLMGGKFLRDSNLGVRERGFRLGHFDIRALLPSQRQLENYTFKSHPLKGYQWSLLNFSLLVSRLSSLRTRETINVDVIDNVFEHKHDMLTNFVSCVFRFYILITIYPPYSAALCLGTVQTGRAQLEFVVFELGSFTKRA